TVTAAYDRLRAQGVLQSRTGAGSYVTLPAGTRPTPSRARWAPPATHTDEHDLSCAALPAPPGLFPDVLIGADVRIAELGHGSGYDPLRRTDRREAIAALFVSHGVCSDR